MCIGWLNQRPFEPSSFSLKKGARLLLSAVSFSCTDHMEAHDAVSWHRSQSDPGPLDATEFAAPLRRH